MMIDKSVDVWPKNKIHIVGEMGDKEEASARNILLQDTQVALHNERYRCSGTTANHGQFNFYAFFSYLANKIVYYLDIYFGYTGMVLARVRA